MKQLCALAILALFSAGNACLAQNSANALNLSQAKKLFVADSVQVAPDGKVILSYSFRTDRELADFEVSPGTAKLTASHLVLEPGASIKHKAMFQGAAEIRCKMALANWKSDLIGTTAGQGVYSDSYNAWLIHIKSPFTTPKNTEAKYDKRYTKSGDATHYFPVDFTLDENRTALKFDKFENKDIVLALAGPNPSIGAFILYGGSGGSHIRELVITGKLDPAWLAKQQ